MQILLLSIAGSINTSLQVGDAIYYSSTTPVLNSGFSTSGSLIVFLGTVTDIDHALSQVSVMYDNLGPDGIANSGDEVTPPVINNYIMFGKNKAVNSSSLTGYYADIKFKNYRTDKIELFSVGSEVSQSSK